MPAKKIFPLALSLILPKLAIAWPVEDKQAALQQIQPQKQKCF